MAGRPRWCDHVEPATAVVDCNGERHRVTWRRGKVVLEDHDLTAETAMLAFGGKPFACLGVLKRWRDMHTWAMSAELFRQMQARLGPDVVLPEDLKPVHQLGLMLTWERGWRRSAYLAGYERLLHDEVRKRALPPLRRHIAYWRQRSGARLVSSLDVRLQRPGKAPRFIGSMDRVRVSATAALGVSWILGVWARGVAEAEGAFVLAVEEEVAGSGDLRVRAVRWEERNGAWSPVTATARVGIEPEGAHRLAWCD
ncbi:MAG: hypothetical protein M3N31_01695 [Actinomycetota bacterium]|nr:hypothetical protein [Actinomycetota bacterium]